jgi:hypothetical protein
MTPAACTAPITLNLRVMDLTLEGTRSSNVSIGLQGVTLDQAEALLKMAVLGAHLANPDCGVFGFVMDDVDGRAAANEGRYNVVK